MIASAKINIFFCPQMHVSKRDQRSIRIPRRLRLLIRSWRRHLPPPQDLRPAPGEHARRTRQSLPPPKHEDQLHRLASPQVRFSRLRVHHRHPTTRCRLRQSHHQNDHRGITALKHENALSTTNERWFRNEFTSSWPPSANEKNLTLTRREDTSKCQNNPEAVSGERHNIKAAEEEEDAREEARNESSEDAVCYPPLVYHHVDAL